MRVWPPRCLQPFTVFVVGLGTLAGACTVERKGIDSDPARPSPGGGVVVGGEERAGGSGGGGGGATAPGGAGGAGGSAGAGGGGPAGTSGTRTLDGGRPLDGPGPDGGAAPPPVPTDAAAAGDLAVSDEAGTDPPPPAAPDAAPPPADLPPPAGEERCPQNPALALCLTFETGIGDESSYRHPVQVESAATVAATGGGGRALTTGAGSLVRVAEAAAFDTQAFTLEAWVQPRAVPAAGQRAGLIDNDAEYGLFLQPGGAIACTAGITAVTTAAAAVRAGEWASVACTLGAGEMVVWVDGRPMGRAAQAGPVSTAGTNGVTIGSNNPSGMNFDGLMDNVRLWRQARNQGQICAAARSCER